MISRTKVKSRLARKTNPELVETISLVLKNPNWKSLSAALSSSTRSQSSLNLFQIDAKTKEGDTVVVPGKVLSKGNLSKKVRICALSFSEKAKEKMKETKSEAVSILEEIKKNPKMEGVRILK